jgi:hypothetical protein
MKTKTQILKTLIGLTLTMLLNSQAVFSQRKQKIAVTGIDTKDISIDKEVIRNIVLLELEKTDVYEVMDRYDLADIIRNEGIEVDNCYGKNCQVRVGTLFQSDKMLTGSIEKYGGKLIVILRLIDVKSEQIEKTDVMEYINQQDHIQTLIRLSINNIVGVENEKLLLDLLVNYDQPIITSKTTLKLSGPRVGASHWWGRHANRLQAPTSQGGFDMYAVNSIIGYQFEQQFLSSGDFQALLEVIPAITGMESGVVVPSLSTLLGFRFNKSGFEIGLGPVLRLTKTAYGYYDGNGNWQLANTLPYDSPIQPFKGLDSRGKLEVSSGMIFAVGKTFKSGYLNVPVNVYYSPNKEGSMVGLMVGFNVAKRPKF